MFVRRITLPKLFVGFAPEKAPSLAASGEPTTEAWRFFMEVAAKGQLPPWPACEMGRSRCPAELQAPGGYLVEFPDDGGRMKVVTGGVEKEIPCWKLGFSSKPDTPAEITVRLPRAVWLLPQVKLARSGEEAAFFDPGAPLAEVPGSRVSSPAEYLARFGREVTMWLMQAVVEATDEVVNHNTDAGATPERLRLRRWEFVETRHLPFWDVNLRQDSRPVVVDFRHLLARVPGFEPDQDEGWMPVIQVVRGPGEQTLHHSQRGVDWDVDSYFDKDRARFLGEAPSQPRRRGRRRNRRREVSAEGQNA